MSSRVLTSAEMSAVPFRYICCIEGIPRSGAPSILGTGVLVDPCTVLTAAHNLVNPRTGARPLPSRIRVTPGRAGTDRPFGSSLAAALIINPEFSHTFPHGPDDFAVIRLARSFDRTAGFWGEPPRPGDADGAEAAEVTPKGPDRRTPTQTQCWRGAVDQHGVWSRIL